MVFKAPILYRMSDKIQVKSVHTTEFNPSLLWHWQRNSTQSFTKIWVRAEWNQSLDEYSAQGDLANIPPKSQGVPQFFILCLRKKCHEFYIKDAHNHDTCNILTQIVLLRLRVFFFFFFFFFLKIDCVCHVWCNFKPGYTCRTTCTIIFNFNSFALNNSFSYRNAFHNDVNACQKWLNVFFFFFFFFFWSNRSEFCVVWTIQFCSNLLACSINIFEGMWERLLFI